MSTQHFVVLTAGSDGKINANVRKSLKCINEQNFVYETFCSSMREANIIKKAFNTGKRFDVSQSKKAGYYIDDLCDRERLRQLLY